MAEAADCRNTCSQTGVIKYSGEFRGGPNSAVLLRRKRLDGSSCKKKRKRETKREGRVGRRKGTCGKRSTRTPQTPSESVCLVCRGSCRAVSRKGDGVAGEFGKRDSNRGPRRVDAKANGERSSLVKGRDDRKGERERNGRRESGLKASRRHRGMMNAFGKGAA